MTFSIFVFLTMQSYLNHIWFRPISFNINYFVSEAVSCVRFTRDGQCILIGSTDTTIKLLDKDSGEMLNE